MYPNKLRGMENKRKKLNPVEWAMHYKQIVIMLVCGLMAFGIYGLSRMKKNEFPDFTIRQGIVVAACPGFTAEEIEQQVTKPLEDYIFSYKEVKKSKTQSVSTDGMAVIQVQLNDDLNNKDEFWNKFRHGVSVFKNELPKSVLAVQVMDDFGDTSALLITLESKDKTYRELDDYMDNLKDRLRRIEDVGRMSVYGMQDEQISIYIDNTRLTNYGLNDRTLAMTLFSKGFTTAGGRLKDENLTSPIYVSRSMNSLRDVENIIVSTTPNGHSVRLRDIATVKREYPCPESFITNNGVKCLLLSVEMKKGRNIVSMGDDVKKELDVFEQTLPDDVRIFTITDQSQVVSESVSTFLKELLIAICAVILVVMLLLPVRVALVAASTIPVTIFISLGLFYAFGVELNTVTLAALIVTLGMIVDNSIVIIDSYIDMISDGISRREASVKSATHFFKSIFSATLAISITFFPFLFTMTGMTHDFVASFPWAVTLILAISLLVAELLVPFLQYRFIKVSEKINPAKKKAFSMLDFIQHGYNKILDLCFRFPKITLGFGVIAIILGTMMMETLPQRLLPAADRNQFAVDIYMPTGTSVEKTSHIADSLEVILRKDSRVVSVASFKGCGSPRFQTSYAPQMGGPNYAQFIVNTKSNEATREILNEYTSCYREAFPEAVIKFKQLCYSEAVSPVEVRLSGENLHELISVADSVIGIMQSMPELNLIRTNLNEPLFATRVTLNEDAANRLGVTNASLESILAMRYTGGVPVGTVWENDHDVNVVLKSLHSDSPSFSDLKNEMIPVLEGIGNAPLRQFADVSASWEYGQIARRNGIRTVTIMAEVERDGNVMSLTGKLKEALGSVSLPDGVSLTYGGELEENEEQMPNIMAGLFIAIAIIFLILVFHFRQIKTSVLILVSLALCLVGTAVGVRIQGVDFGVTCVMGVVSLMGILVRNCIIMIDYAEELRDVEHMSERDAIYYSAKRRMRPIFLTSAAASMGVIPMILGGSGLWTPMGTVIFYGTLITMVLILTVVPIAYWQMRLRSNKSFKSE